MKPLPYGPRAVLVEFDTLAQVMHASEWWQSHPPAGAVDVVPAARTVLLVHDGTLDSASLEVPAAFDRSAVEETTVELDVTYDGDDLADVAARVGVSVEEVVRRHSECTYTVAFCGFMPGFAYMVGLPPELHLPRRDTPRTRVPAGAVAIAAEFAGVYPRESPGGWHLLGRTDATLWDETGSVPALLAPGTTVRFRPR